MKNFVKRCWGYIKTIIAELNDYGAQRIRHPLFITFLAVFTVRNWELLYDFLVNGYIEREDIRLIFNNWISGLVVPFLYSIGIVVFYGPFKSALEVASFTLSKLALSLKKKFDISQVVSVAEFNQVRESLERAIKEREELRLAASTQKIEEDKRISELDGKNRELQVQISGLQNEVNKYKRDLEDYEKVRADLIIESDQRVQLQEKLDHYIELEQISNNKISELMQRLTDSEKNIATNNSEIESLAVEKEILQREANEAASRNKSLERHLSDLSGKYDQLYSDRLSVEEENDRLRKEAKFLTRSYEYNEEKTKNIEGLLNNIQSVLEDSSKVKNLMAKYHSMESNKSADSLRLDMIREMIWGYYREGKNSRKD